MIPVGGDLGRPWASDDGSDVRQAAGFGIGLSIARSIAEGHRGSIRAKSADDGRAIEFISELK